MPVKCRHHDCRTSTAAHDSLRRDLWPEPISLGQALWQPGGAEEGSHVHEGDRHLCLAYNEEREDLGK